VIKRYHRPATPFQRLLDDARTPEDSRLRLKAMYLTLDPVRLHNAAENPCKRGYIYDCFILNQCCRAASTWRLLRSGSSATVASPGFVANFWKGRSNRYCCTQLYSERGELLKCGLAAG
jgi:hypothetical protein